MFFFQNSHFGNGKDRGWWEVSAIVLHVGLDREAEILQAAECAIALAAACCICMFIIYLVY